MYVLDTATRLRFFYFREETVLYLQAHVSLEISINIVVVVVVVAAIS